MKKDWRDPIHPGEHLSDELDEIGMNGHELAKRLNVPPNRISQILNGKRGVTADTAMRLGKFFGTGPEFWLSIQQKYDLELARKEGAGDLKTIEPLKKIEHKSLPQAGMNL
ncbi:MAG: HigA family addiction module antitoxin [Nitrospinales bacterium]